MPVIETVSGLKAALAEVFADIGASCAVCRDPDCVGYIWVLPEEEDGLLDAGVQLVQINGADGPVYLDNYPRTPTGALVVDRLKTACPYRDAAGRCTIHADRPLNCHLYPLGLQPDGAGGYCWALHLDCEFVRAHERDGRLPTLLANLGDLVDRVGADLGGRLLAEFGKVDELSEYEGEIRFVPVRRLAPAPGGGALAEPLPGAANHP